MVTMISHDTRQGITLDAHSIVAFIQSNVVLVIKISRICERTEVACFGRKNANEPFGSWESQLFAWKEAEFLSPKAILADKRENVSWTVLSHLAHASVLTVCSLTQLIHYGDSLFSLLLCRNPIKGCLWCLRCRIDNNTKKP